MTDAERETLEQRVAETLDWLEQVPTSAIERDAAQTIRSLLAECERLKKEKRDVAEDVWLLNAECNLRQRYIEAALEAINVGRSDKSIAAILKGEE